MQNPTEDRAFLPGHDTNSLRAVQISSVVALLASGTAIVDYAECGFSWPQRVPIAETEQRLMSSVKLFDPHG